MIPKFRIVGLLLLMVVVFYAESGKLTVKINGVKNDEGVVHVLLFNNSEGFPSEHEDSMKRLTVDASTDTIVAIIDSLEYKTYAVSVMHDKNENNKLDTTFYGKPKEGVGVSNNVKPKMRAPKFEEASFELNSAELTLDVKVSYP